MINQTLPDSNVQRSDDPFNFEAPYLIEKLLKERIAETTAEAEQLFTEVKRFLILAESDRTKIWEMYSLRVDEAWHQFVLFTGEYTRFCRRFFGHYISHEPSNAPKPSGEDLREVISFAYFAREYERFFGMPIPSVWFDERSITTRRRVINDHAGQLQLQSVDGMVELVDAEGCPIFSVNELAGKAITFIANTGAFYVRELPGELSDDERVDLIATLVEAKFLRVAS